MCARTRAGRRPARNTKAVRARTLPGPASVSPGPAEASRPARRSAPILAAELCARSRRTSSLARSFSRGRLLLLLRLRLWLPLGLDRGLGLGCRRLLHGLGSDFGLGFGLDGLD